MDKNQGIIALSAVILVAGLGLLFVMNSGDEAVAGQAFTQVVRTSTIDTSQLKTTVLQPGALQEVTNYDESYNDLALPQIQATTIPKQDPCVLIQNLLAGEVTGQDLWGAQLLFEISDQYGTPNAQLKSYVDSYMGAAREYCGCKYASLFDQINVDRYNSAVAGIDSWLDSYIASIGNVDAQAEAELRANVVTAIDETKDYFTDQFFREWECPDSSTSSEFSCTDYVTQSAINNVYTASVASEMYDDADKTYQEIITGYITSVKDLGCFCKYADNIQIRLDAAKNEFTNTLQSSLADAEATDTSGLTAEQLAQVNAAIALLESTLNSDAIDTVYNYFSEVIRKEESLCPGDSSTKDDCTTIAENVDGMSNVDFVSSFLISKVRECGCDVIKTEYMEYVNNGGSQFREVWANVLEKYCPGDSTCEEGDDCSFEFTGFCANYVTAKEICYTYCPIPSENCERTYEGVRGDETDDVYTCTYQS